MRDFRWCTKCHGCGYSTLPNLKVVECEHCKGTGKEPGKQERNQ